MTRQTLWMGAVTAVRVLGALVHVFVAARVLGLEGYGALAIIIASSTLIHGLIAIPGGDTVTTFVTRGIAEGRREEAASILRFTVAVSVGLSLIAYAVIAVLALTATELLKIDQAYAGAIMLYGLAGVLSATNSETLAVLRLSDRVRVSLAVAIADNLTRIGVFAVVWFAGGGILMVVWATVAGNAVSFVGMLVAALVFAPQAGMAGLLRSSSMRVPADVVRFHAGAYGRTIIGALTQNVDTLLLAQFAATADVGLYRAARQIMDVTRRPFHLIRFGVQPELSRQWYAGEGAALRDTVRRFTVYSVVLAIVGYTGLAIFREPVATLVLGTGFADVAPLLLILIPGAFVASAAVLGGLPIAVGRVWPLLASAATGLAVLVVTIVWLVPLLGSEGAAWARTASSVATVLVLFPFVAAILRQSYRT